MRKLFFRLQFIAISIFLSSSILAQDYNGDLKYRKWRVTIFPPLSTNGINAVDYTAKYSINLIGGYHGGLDGAEIGGIFNYEKDYAYGLQIAGITNISGGDMAGVNIAGILNFARDDMSGIQLAGLVNYSEESLEGIQATAGINFSKRTTSGLQFAGIGNAGTSSLEGLQVAGIFNATTNDISGLQAAGIFNVARDNVEGLQAAGFLNFAGDDISGLQAAGGANIAFGEIEGLLVSGLLNYAMEDASGLLVSGGINIAPSLEGAAFAGIGNIATELQGLQFGGFNLAERAQGLQIGIINIAKEFQGVPIGVLSLYGNGRYNFDVKYSDAGFTDIGFTTGTHRVYNTAIIGYNTSLDRDVYRVGVAVGLEKNIEDSFENVRSNTLFVNQEVSVTHHFEGDWSRRLNRVYSYKYLIGNRFGNGLSIYGGPSLNMQISRVNSSNDYTWYSLWSPTRKGRQYRFWAGFTVGLRLFKQKDLPLLDDEFGEEWDWDW